MKGLGSVMVAVVFLSIIVISVVPLAMHMYNASVEREPVYEDPAYSVFQLSMKVLSRDIMAFFNATNLTLQIVNRGGADLHIERGVAYVLCSNGEMYVDMKTGITIPSGQTRLLQININQDACRDPRPRTLHVITRDGSVISSTVVTIEDIQEIIRGNRTSTGRSTAAITQAITALPIRVTRNENISSISVLTRKGFEIHTLDSMDRPTRLRSYTDFLSRGMSGGTTTRYVWRLNALYANTSIGISRQTVRNLWIGYDPRNPTRYNIIITADGISLSVGGTSRSFSSYVRIKVYGFRPSTTQGILQLGSSWVTQPSQDVADYTFLTTDRTTTRLTMSGTADRIEIYTRSQATDSGYDPYIMFMNTDRSEGSSGLLFTTIDRIYGSHISRNEGADALLDYSTTPLVLVYRGYIISNINNSAVVIAVNYRFHDNEGSDAQGTSVDRPIMFVGLVEDNGVIYSYRSYTFRELTRYEDTDPPTAQAQSSLVFVPLPPRDGRERIFHVFIAVQDPYSYSGNLDDLDFTLYVESLSIIPIS